MRSLLDAPVGYTSTVHQGLIHEPRLWKAPLKFVVYNLMLCMMMCLWVSWRWVFITGAVHGAAALCWMYDPHLLAVIWRAVRLPSSWGV